MQVFLYNDLNEVDQSKIESFINWLNLLNGMYRWWWFRTCHYYHPQQEQKQENQFDETKDGHAQEEAYLPCNLFNELQTVSREIINLIIFKWLHVKLQNNYARIGSLDGLTWICHLGLDWLPLKISDDRKRRIHGVPINKC